MRDTFSSGDERVAAAGRGGQQDEARQDLRNLHAREPPRPTGIATATAELERPEI